MGLAPASGRDRVVRQVRMRARVLGEGRPKSEASGFGEGRQCPVHGGKVVVLGPKVEGATRRGDVGKQFEAKKRRENESAKRGD